MYKYLGIATLFFKHQYCFNFHVIELQYWGWGGVLIVMYLNGF